MRCPASTHVDMIPVCHEVNRPAGSVSRLCVVVVIRDKHIECHMCRPAAFATGMS